MNQELYMATIGGLGLTGIITKACFTLKKIDNPLYQVYRHSAFPIKIPWNMVMEFLGTI